MFLFWFGAVFSAPVLAIEHTARLALGVLAADAGFFTPVPAVPADQLLIPCEPRGSPFVPFKPGHLPFCSVHILPPLFLFRPLGNPSDPQHRSPAHSPPAPQSSPLKPPPSASFPTHGNLRPAHSIAALRKAHLFRKAHRSNRSPPPASPPTGISARLTAPQLFAKPTCSAQPTAQTAAQRQLPRTQKSPPSPQHHSPSQGHLFRTDRLFPHQTAAAVGNHTPVSSIQWMGWLSQ